MKIYFVCSPDRMVFAWGQTTRSYQERHKDGDWNKLRTYLRARGEDVILLAWYENVDIQDHDIHKHLKTVPGIPFPKRGEWSGYDSKMHTLESIQHLVEKKFFIESVRKDLKLRPHQEKFVEKILSNWEQWTEFLLFAKCRGGKSIMTLSTIVEADVKRTLIVSRFNSPKQSWFDDCNKFGKFKNIRVVKLNEDKWVNEYKRWADDPDIHIIFWSTVQGLCASKKSRLNKLKRLTSIELIVFDECHIGEDANQFKKVRDKFKDAKCLKVSGTAYDQVWKYPKEHRFVYSYWDEQYYYPGKYPRMNVYTIAINVPGYREIFGDDPDAFTNIFLVNDDKTAFLYPDLVRNFWNKYFTTLGQRHLRHNGRIIINRNHIIASLPSVAACRLSVPLISDYAALDVTGISGEDSDTINKFVKEHAKTICLTVEANILGVTCEEWDCVGHIWKGEDKKRWGQTSFRGGSGKHHWDVVDFAPKRALKSLQDSLTLAKVENPELLDYEITDFTNVFEWDDKFNQLSQDNVFDILAVDVKEDVQGSFRNLSRSISDDRLTEENFNTVDLASDKKPQSNMDMVNDNDTNDESAKKLVEGFGDKKPTQKEKNKNRKKLEQILNSIPLVLAHSTKSGNPVRTTDELFASEFYEPITQDTESVVYNLLQTRDMSARDITTIIHQNNPIIDKSVRNDFTKTLDSFRITKQTQQVIPLDLLKKLLPKVDDDNYVLIVGDPSGSCCSYVIEHLGVPPSNVWVWEDHPTHKFLIQSISSEINILKNIEDYRMDKSKTYCIGNPPYSSEDRNDNQKEWKKHLFSAMSRAKTTSFVVPASVISPSIHFNEIKPHLSYILTDVKKYFPKTASTFVVITVEDSIQDQCLIETKDDTFEIVLKDIQFLPNNITRENIEYLQKTLKGGREWKSNSVYPSSINYRHQWEDPEGKIEVLHTNNKSFFTDKESSLNKEIRVAVTKSGEPNFQVVQNKGLTECMIYTDGFDTLDEAQKYCDFCNSEVIQKALSLSKFSGWTTRTVINNIPNILDEE